MRKRIMLLAAAFFSTLCGAAIPGPVLKAEFDGTTETGKLSGKADYIDGVRGKAIVLADALVTFPQIGKLDTGEGTATIWIKPVNWKWSKKEFVFFLNTVVNKTNRFALYKYNLPLGLLAFYGSPGKHGVTQTYVNRRNEFLPDDTWLAVGAVWSKKAQLLTLYINGEPVHSRKIPLSAKPERFDTWIVNGLPHFPRDRKNATAFDMLRIYDRALTESEMKELYAKERPETVRFEPSKIRHFVFNLPRLAVPPKIDGNAGDAEWAGAAKFGGYTNSKLMQLDTAYPGDLYAGYCGGKIYLRCDFKLPGATQITANKTKRDSPVYYDDCAEVLLRPDSKKSGYYQGIFNNRGAIFDQCDGKKEWNGAWEVKSNVYEGTLIFEIAVPASELEASLRDGAVWNVNFGRNRIVDRAVVFSSIGVTDGSNWFDLVGKAKITEAGLSGRLTFDYQQLFNRKLELSYLVSNRSSSPEKVRFDVELLSPEMTVVEKKSLTAEIPGNGSHAFTCANPLRGLRGVLIRLTATREGQEKPFYVHDFPVVFKDEFRISDETDLKNETLTVNVDCTSHRMTRNAACVTGKLGGRTVNFTGLPQAKGVFSLKGLEKGDYTVELVFKDASGKEILRHKRPYNHIGRPEWLSVHYGADPGVLWPFTPLKLENSVFRVWGRTHKFGRNLLPEEILSQKRPLFSAPPELRITVDGKKHVVNNFKFEVEKNKPDQAVMTFTGSAGGVSFTGSVVMEFDGFIWYEFDMKGPKEKTIDDLRLVMPLAPGVAEFHNAHYFVREREGGRLNLPKTLKRYPSVWVGNLDIGLTFLVESYKSWRHRDVNKVFEFAENGKGADWTVRIIDRPVKLDRPYHYGFGIEANPVKPTPSWFRSWRIGPFKPYNIMHPWAFPRRAAKKYNDFEQGLHTPIFRSRQIFLDLLERERKKNAEFVVYLNPGLANSEFTEWQVFRKEWTNPYGAYPMCANSSFTDFILSCMHGLCKDGLKMIYVDSLGAPNCYNPLHGCGYIDEETGETALTWPIHGIRDYMKRLYGLLHPYDGRNQKEYFLWVHTSARNCAALNAFVDASCGGEEQENRAAVNPNYLELYPLDEFQSYYNHTLSGISMMCSNLGRIGDRNVRNIIPLNDQVLLLLLLHDCITWPCYMNQRYTNEFYAKLDEWGYKDERLKFHSFRTQKMIVSPDKDIHVSVYTLSDRALAVIGNWQKVPRKVSVKIDKKALGLGDDLTFTDLRSGKVVDPASFELPGYNFILMDIRKKQTDRKDKK